MQFRTKLGLVDIPNEDVLRASREIVGSARGPSDIAAPSGSLAVATCSLEAVRAMELAHDALGDAWRDLLEWEQLATNTRKALKESGKSPDHEPYCPSEQGIARTEIVRHAVGRAATELRKHLPQENTADQRRSPE